MGRITPSGTVTEFFAGITANPHEITAGPDGNLWFTEYTATPGLVGRITPSGTVTEFSAGITGLPDGIVVGPDGNLWFTEFDGEDVGRITPSGTVTEFPADVPPFGGLGDIVAGADGNLWFAQRDGGVVGRITPSGTVTKFSAGITAGSSPEGITAGPDGNLWFTERGGSRVGRITTAAPPPLVSTGPASAITAAAGVSGSVNTAGTATSARFEYGPTPAYGLTTPAQTVNGTSAVPLSASLAGLQPATTYHYRLVAANTLGASEGADGTFTTASAQAVRIAILTRRARVISPGATKITLACGNGSGRCAGKLTLTRSVRVRVLGAQTLRVMIQLAATRFSIAAGKRAKVRLKLGRTARRGRR